MVAGILEKSKRLRWILCFAILRNSCFQAAWGCGTERDDGAKNRATTIANELTSGVLEKKDRGPRKDRSVPGRHVRRLLLNNLQSSAPVQRLVPPRRPRDRLPYFIPATRFHSASWVYLEDA